MTRYPSLDLSDSVVVITGGARGIGAATVSAFADLRRDCVLG